MDKDTERYFENYFDMFATEGWKQFMEDMEENKSTLSSIMSIKEANDFFYRKGQVTTLSLILNFQDSIEQSFKEHKNETDV